MRNCNKCLNNVWSFKKVDDTIEATCNICGNEVSFLAKSKPPVVDTCRNCNGKLVLVEFKFKPKKLKKSFYFTHGYVCQKCGRKYNSNNHKVFNSPVKEVNPLQANIVAYIENREMQKSDKFIK